MPARKARLPITTGVQRTPVVFSDDAWKRIETAFRRGEVGAETRDRIENATSDFLCSAKMEIAAASMTEANMEVARTLDATLALVERLKPKHSCESDVHTFIEHQISRRLQALTRWPLADHLGDLLRGLELLASALTEIDSEGARKAAVVEVEGARTEHKGQVVPIPTEKARNYVSAVTQARFEELCSSGVQQKGNALKCWIRAIQEAFKKGGMKVGRSKADDSPFPRLLRALIKELPPDASDVRRHLPNSLGDVIYKAAR